MNKCKHCVLLCFTLLISGCSSIKIFPDELNIYGTGEKNNLSQVLKLLKKDKNKNAAIAIAIWKKSVGY